MCFFVVDVISEFKEIIIIHPRTEEDTTFLISDGMVYEPRVYKQEIGSFFLGDTVDPGLCLPI